MVVPAAGRPLNNGHFPQGVRGIVPPASPAPPRVRGRGSKRGDALLCWFQGGVNNVADDCIVLASLELIEHLDFDCFLFFDFILDREAIIATRIRPNTNDSRVNSSYSANMKPGIPYIIRVAHGPEYCY